MTHGTTRNAAESTPDRTTESTPNRTDELVSRLEAVERTLTGTDTEVSALEDVAAIESRISDLESTVETISNRLDEVDAATQAVRGYVGGVRTVNEDVERRANAALAKAESLEAALVDESESGLGMDDVVPSNPPNATGNGPNAPGFDPEAGETTTTPAHDAHASRPHPTSGPHSPSEFDQRPRGEQTDDDTRRGLASRLRDVL